MALSQPRRPATTSVDGTHDDDENYNDNDDMDTYQHNNTHTTTGAPSHARTPSTHHKHKHHHARTPAVNWVLFLWEELVARIRGPHNSWGRQHHRGQWQRMQEVPHDVDHYVDHYVDQGVDHHHGNLLSSYKGPLRQPSQQVAIPMDPSPSYFPHAPPHTTTTLGESTSCTHPPHGALPSPTRRPGSPTWVHQGLHMGPSPPSTSQQQTSSSQQASAGGGVTATTTTTTNSNNYINMLGGGYSRDASGGVVSGGVGGVHGGGSGHPTGSNPGGSAFTGSGRGGRNATSSRPGSAGGMLETTFRGSGGGGGGMTNNGGVGLWSGQHASNSGGGDFMGGDGSVHMGASMQAGTRVHGGGAVGVAVTSPYPAATTACTAATTAGSGWGVRVRQWVQWAALRLRGTVRKGSGLTLAVGGGSAQRLYRDVFRLHTKVCLWVGVGVWGWSVWEIQVCGA